MQSQAIKSEPLLSCDASKRKRLNRTAKLKQYKLDARREQWLSQGKNCSRSEQDLHSKGWKDNEHKEGETSSGVFEQNISPKSEALSVNDFKILSEEFTGSVSEDSENESSVVNPYEDQADSIVSGATFIEGRGSSNIILKDCGLTNADKSKSESAPVDFHHNSSQNCVNDMLTVQKGKRENSKERRKASGIRNVLKPYGFTDSFSQMKQKQDHVKDWLHSDVSACLSNNSPTSDSAVSASSKGTEESLDEEDWEAAADALYAKTSLDCKETSASESRTLKVQQYSPVERDRETKVRDGRSDLQNSLLKPDYKPKLNPFFSRSSSTGSCAWRPDDVSRPPTLPVLKKQQSTPRDSSSRVWSPVFVKSLWPSPVVPAECPICAEELDSTDSSFVPCTCGFCPCLFCVHRIASEDGRCPGCRREYSFDVKSAHSSSIRLRR